MKKLVLSLSVAALLAACNGSGSSEKPATDTVKTETPQTNDPAPQTDTAKAEAPKADSTKKEEAPKADSPKVEEKKK